MVIAKQHQAPFENRLELSSYVSVLRYARLLRSKNAKLSKLHTPWIYNINDIAEIAAAEEIHAHLVRAMESPHTETKILSSVNGLGLEHGFTLSSLDEAKARIIGLLYRRKFRTKRGISYVCDLVKNASNVVIQALQQD